MEEAAVGPVVAAEDIPPLRKERPKAPSCFCWQREEAVEAVCLGCLVLL